MNPSTRRDPRNQFLALHVPEGIIDLDNPMQASKHGAFRERATGIEPAPSDWKPYLVSHREARNRWAAMAWTTTWYQAVRCTCDP